MHLGFASRSVLTFALAGLLNSVASAGQIRVPADQPTLRLALLAAQPGDVILVQTAAPQDCVVITKPVTIIGDPVLLLWENEPNCGTKATVELAGPGSGAVAISNAVVYGSFDCYYPATPIGGTGFTSLFLYNVNIPKPNAGLTGIGVGVEGLRTTGIPFVALERCHIDSAQNNTDDCTQGSAVQLGIANHAAVDVGHGSLLVLDSKLHGSSGGFLCSKNAIFCPGGLATAGGEGASAVKAGSVHAANSILTAGVGTTYVAWTGYPGKSQSQVCWVYGSYPAVIATTYVTLPGAIAATGDAKLGGQWQLEFDLPSGASYALFSYGVGRPIELPGLGTAFLDSATFTVLGLLSATGGVGTKSYVVPASTSLLGLQIALQPLHAGQGLLRPVAAAIIP
ncbi:MAG: hypothetical protein EPO68_05660 [Planctomycetota bacterium]|nr:MAG: hypothetical protein EPO68_05660 [Planctomycetota bacterium]